MIIMSFHVPRQRSGRGSFHKEFIGRKMNQKLQNVDFKANPGYGPAIYVYITSEHWPAEPQTLECFKATEVTFNTAIV